jgi:EAL domain-containing protein (putative c-di-GMP-specific phosphodiesterase class I)
VFVRPDNNTPGGAVDRRRITVAIAENDPRLRQAMAHLVGADPAFELLATAGDAEDAIDVGRCHKPEVMLLDVALPKGPGARVVRALSLVSPRTRVVALSSFGDRKQVVQMLDAGAVGYLVKSADLDLLGALRSVHHGNHLLSTEEIQATIDARSFAVAFQPIFSLRSGVAVGVEALCRLSPGRGLTADMWFAEARAAGLGVELELAVLTSALEAARRRPVGLFLSVNVSPQVVTKPEFIDLVRRSGEARQLVIEIAEPDAVKEYETLNEELREARQLGVQVAVDDVGVGYVDLHHVLILRPDMVKLDITLTAEIDTDRSHQVLAKEIAAAARKLGATVVAEGIETRRQFDTLTAVGVEYGQGYHLARPGPLLEPFPLRVGS